MRKYKILVGSLGVIISIISGYQSIIIAQVGAANDIAQLQGDGGSGVVSAALCFIAGLLCFGKPNLAGITFVLSAIVGAVYGLFYEDVLLFIWGVAALLLTVASFYIKFMTTSGRAKS